MHWLPGIPDRTSLLGRLQAQQEAVSAGWLLPGEKVSEIDVGK